MAGKPLARRIGADFVLNRELYLMILPVLLVYILFHYLPMYGAQIAFRDYSPGAGITGSEWVGFSNFTDFFGQYYFWRILKNTVLISVSMILFGFPAPIILALLINELRSRRFSRIVQTVSYMPHFISLVVVCGLILDFTRDSGVISALLARLGVKPATMLNNPGNFLPIYVISGIWQEIGWGSIIYLAALTGIDQEQYEAARIDGAGRWRQLLYITLPNLMPTIIVMLILRLGGIMNVGFEKIILLYNPAIYESADVISSFVYRDGLQNFNWSSSSAVGLFNSCVNFTFLLCANWISKRVNQTSLW